MSKILNNKFILGTVQMGLSYGINNTKGKISLDNSLKILEYAFDNGIETLDSAESYGNAHQVIGIFHKKNQTKKFKVITKLPHQINEDIVKKVDRYLNELNITQLDTLMFHCYSSYEDNIDNFDVLKRLKSKNIIKNLGVSVYTNNEIDNVILNEDINVIQLPFNLLDNINLRNDILKEAKSKGKIIHTRSALLQGLFFKDKNDSNVNVQNLKNELSLLTEISKRDNVSISELALSYCLKQNTIDNVLIGVDSVNQLKDNIKTVNYSLKQKSIDSINAIKVQNIDLLNPSLWK